MIQSVSKKLKEQSEEHCFRYLLERNVESYDVNQALSVNLDSLVVAFDFMKYLVLFVDLHALFYRKV